MESDVQVVVEVEADADPGAGAVLAQAESQTAGELNVGKGTLDSYRGAQLMAPTGCGMAVCIRVDGSKVRDGISIDDSSEVGLLQHR